MRRVGRPARAKAVRNAARPLAVCVRGALPVVVACPVRPRGHRCRWPPVRSFGPVPPPSPAARLPSRGIAGPPSSVASPCRRPHVAHPVPKLRVRSFDRETSIRRRPGVAGATRPVRPSTDTLRVSPAGRRPRARPSRYRCACFLRSRAAGSRGPGAGCYVLTRVAPRSVALTCSAPALAVPREDRIPRSLLRARPPFPVAWEISTPVPGAAQGVRRRFSVGRNLLSPNVFRGRREPVDEPVGNV